MKLVDSIVNRNFVEADSIISETVELIMKKKLEEAKKMYAAKMCEQGMNATAAELRRKDIVEDDNVEEAVDPTEIHNGPAPTGQRVNQAGKGNKENTTVVPKNNLKEEEQLPPSKILSKKANDYSKQQDKATNAMAILHTDYGTNSSIGKKASAVYDTYRSRTAKAAKDASDASRAERKDADASRVTNKLSNLAKDGGISKDTAGKLIYRAKANILGGDYAKRNAAQSEPIKEEEQLDEARVKIIKARIRGGKIQRRKKVSNVPGMTLRGGKLQRMSPAERRRRKMGAKRAKIKRKSKMTRTLMKRQRSLRKRKALGL